MVGRRMDDDPDPDPGKRPWFGGRLQTWQGRMVVVALIFLAIGVVQLAHGGSTRYLPVVAALAVVVVVRSLARRR